jgi:hypothetical protein
MKPSSASGLVSRGVELLSRPAETPTTKQSEPTEPTLDEFAELDRQRKEFLQQQMQKKAERDESRSKFKTQRLVQLCGQVMHRERKSEAWLAKYEKFFRSPVWKLVSDEAIRKAHFVCEYWKCTQQAQRAHLLEFPEEHLEMNFDWLNRNDILIALCGQHHLMMHGFVMKRVVPLARQFDSRPAALLSVPTRRPSATLSQSV